MALSDEQNAMLRLLAQGEQGYGDIAALLGLGEDEVRAKVVGALAQLEAEGKPAPDIPPPIAGGAKPAAEVDPPEPEPVEEAPTEADDDDEPVVADAVAPQEPRAATSKAKSAGKSKPSRPVKPKAVPATAAPSRDQSSSGGSSAGGRTVTLPTGRGAWLAGGGVVAAIVVIVVVILLASGGGGGGSSSTATEASSANPPAEAGAEGEKSGTEETAAAKTPTQAELTAVDGSEAKGLATFGRYKNKLALQIEATGLEPTTEGKDSYTIWIAQSAKKMLPIVLGVAVKGSGKGANTIAAQYEVPVEVLAYLANGTFDQIAVTRTETNQLQSALKSAQKEKSTPTYTGEPVLRGTIAGPIVGIAKREAEENEEEGE